MKKQVISWLLVLVILLPCLASCKSDKKVSGTTSTDSQGSPENNSAVNLKIGNPSALGAKSDESSVLPTISISTDSGAKIETKEYEGAKVSVSGATVEECNFSDRTAEAKCRGNYTFTSTEKKSYRVKFEEKINLFNQGRGEAKSWVLMAEHCDQSFLRNHLALAMAQKLDKIAYYSSSSFVNLYINGEYEGIYRVAEQHQVQESRVNINEDPDEIDTDYFIEWDAYANEDGNVEGLNYFRAGKNNFLVKSDNMTEEKCEFLREYFQKVDDALVDKQAKDIKAYLDIDSFVDMYILQEITKNIDVGWSSFFFVKNANGKISCTCPWDFDLAMGNDNRLDDGGYLNLYAGNSEYAFGRNSLDQGNEWLCYLMRNKWFVNLVIKRWDELSAELEKTAVDEALRINNHFGDEIAKNFERWKIFGRQINKEPNAVRQLKSYPAHVDYLVKWTKNRFEWMNEYFADSETKYLTTEYEEETWWKPWW